MRPEKKALYLLADRDCSNCGNRMIITDSMSYDYESSPGIHMPELPDEEVDVYPKMGDVCYKFGRPHTLDPDRICEDWLRKNYES